MNLANSNSRKLARPASRTWMRACAVVAALCWALVAHAASGGIAFEDNFTSRQTTSNTSDTVNGSNVGATVEPGEPKHGGKAGGHSVWISWVAPTNGIVSFTTDGSKFDTLLSAYHLQAGGTNVGQLLEDARNDDDPLNSPYSLIQFGARSGVRYEIAVDGFGGATDDVRLRWDFVATTSAPPVIVGVPLDQAVREGDTVTLSVDMQTSPSVQLRWRYNGNSFDENSALDPNGPVLVITNFQATNVGLYSLRVTIGNARFETTPVELQINSEGQTNALARDKLIDSPGTPLLGDDGNDDLAAHPKKSIAKAGTGVSRGYDGSQIFDTTFATSDPNEPHHCGFVPSASYWYTYQPPTNGTLMINTTGSTYDNIAAAYTYSGTLTSYADLIPIACDHVSAGASASRIEFAVQKAHSYVVIIAGVNGARGYAHLNYHLDMSRQPLAPTLTNAPLALVVPAGVNVDLSPAVAGSAPLRFSWS